MTGQRFELVRCPVTEIQWPRRALLEWIAAMHDLMHMEPGAAGYHRIHDIRFKARHCVRFALDPGKEFGIADERHLDGFGHATAFVSGRKSVEKGRIVDDGERRRKGPKQILGAEGVDGVLDAHAGIILTQYRRRQANVPYATVEDRTREPDGVEHRPPANRHRVGLAIDVPRR